MEGKLKCSVCKCKYIDDDTHIIVNFGYNTLKERYKSCVKCRGRNERVRATNKEHQKEYDKQRRIDKKESDLDGKLELDKYMKQTYDKIHYHDNKQLKLDTISQNVGIT
jgi:hypothetical protein